MRWVMVLFMLALALPAAAQVLDTKEARKTLLSLKGYEVVLADGLSKKDAATVKAIVPLMAEQLRQPVRYYAAIAWSPGDGLVHESLQAAMNFHSVDAARAAATAACAPLRSAGTPPCAVAAVIVPKRYSPRPLTLSLDATAAFDKTFRRAPSPKVFAISRSTGAFGTGANDAAAISACGAADCEVVIRD
ncbi:hypothetical protein [Silicimonas sp. MF1-12-2]|jgi:hypothetical protein|uniref:hypothetical protein n=1 Tax=Silicimonas sp. MF1-12-2 TaxID=3384793 RepID=UPI0039B5D966